MRYIDKLTHWITEESAQPTDQTRILTRLGRTLGVDIERVSSFETVYDTSAGLEQGVIATSHSTGMSLTSHIS